MQFPRILLDVTAPRPIRAVVRSRLFPLGLQLIMLTALTLLAVNGLGLGQDMSAAELKTFRKTNLTTLFVWGLWWPAMVLTALVFGRLWCTVCPLELANRWGYSVARWLGLPRASLGKILRAGWATVAAYLLLQFLVAGFSIHRVPHYTAIVLLSLVGIAWLSGLVYRQPRSFCRAFCPAAALLSVYGRYTPMQLQARSPDVCEGCQGKECIRQDNPRGNHDGRGCPSSLRPFALSPSGGCVLCLQCAKVCPQENICLGVSVADAHARRTALLKPYEAAFVAVALGFVAHQVLGQIKWLDSGFHAVPAHLATLAPVIPFTWFEALWFLVLFPLALWSAVAGVSYVAGHRQGLGALLLAAATGAAPVVALAHLAKALAKLGSWAMFVPLSLRDPRGLETYHGLADGSLDMPPSVFSLSVIGLMLLPILLAFSWRVLRWPRPSAVGSVTAARVGLAAAALLFGGVLAVWILPI